MCASKDILYINLLTLNLIVVYTVLRKDSEKYWGSDDVYSTHFGLVKLVLHTIYIYSSVHTDYAAARPSARQQ